MRKNTLLNLLKWVQEMPIEDVFFLMKEELHLSDKQVVGYLETLKKQKKLVAFSNYNYRLTLKGKRVLLTQLIKGAFTNETN